jgi:LacI family transcriptional regulator
LTRIDPTATMQTIAQSFAERREGLATMKDVAERARVSVSTVSHVVNGTRVVAEGTRERVEAAIEEFGYQGNLLARGLKIQRTFTMGLLISDIQNPFFTAVVRGVEDVALSRGYHLFLCNTDEDPSREEQYVIELTKKRVDGLIVAPAAPRQGVPASQLLRGDTPFVFMDREVEGVQADAVEVDNEHGMRMAVEHLAELGHGRIGLISGPLDKATGYERHEGFRAALSESGLDPEGAPVSFGDFKTASGRRGAEELLRLPVPPTALIAANNQMTLGALLAIRSMRLSVPEDVSVVGYDEMEWASLADPPLTTVAQPAYEMGVEAARLLLNKIWSETDGGPSKVLLEPELIVRESTASPPAGSIRNRAPEGES